MSMVTKNISLTDQQDSWIKARVESGHFCDESEVIRELILEQQAAEWERENIEWVRAEIQKGLKSGTSNRSFDEIVESARRRRKAQNG